MIRGGRPAAVLLLAALAALGPRDAARADEVELAAGATIRGTVTEVGGRLRVNPYRSTVPTMTWGTIDLDPDQVRAVRPERDERTVRTALQDLDEADVATREVLLDLAASLHLQALKRRIAEEILRQAPEHAAALKVVGGSEAWAARRRGDPALDPALALALHRALRLESGAERRAAAADLESRFGLPARPEVLERMARSLAFGRGDHHEVPVRMAEGDLAGATFSVHVPPAYDAVRPVPVLLALHGGVPATTDGLVTGSGRDAHALLVAGARRHGVLLVCPTALEAPWTSRRNRALLETLLAEVEVRWNVDLDRVHVAGQGAGADAAIQAATWWPGSLASVGAAGADDPSPLVALAGRGLGVWLYQGEVDEVVPPAAARRVAERLLRREADLVYTEIPGAGHGLPSAAEEDLYRALLPRRRPRSRKAWPVASFDAPAGEAEIRAFGDPADAWGRTLPADAPPDDLLGRLRRGRGDAEPAARALAREGGHEAGVLEVLADPAVPAAGRGWAAWLLGEGGFGPAADALRDAVRAAEDPGLRRQAARALARLRTPAAVPDLLFALEDAAAAWARPGPDPDVVTWERLAATCAFLADAVEALGACGRDPDLAAEIERTAVRGVLKDGRRIVQDAARGEDGSEPRARLARACGRAYRALGAEPTLQELLEVVLRREPAVLRAAREGAAEGLPAPVR